MSFSAAKECNINLQFFFRDGGRERREERREGTGERREGRGDGTVLQPIEPVGQVSSFKNQKPNQKAAFSLFKKRRGEGSVCGFVQMLETIVLSSWRNEGKEREE